MYRDIVKAEIERRNKEDKRRAEQKSAHDEHENAEKKKKRPIGKKRNAKENGDRSFFTENLEKVIGKISFTDILGKKQKIQELLNTKS